MDATTVSVDGDEIRYVEAGEGTPIVLLHGGIIDAAAVTWPPVIERLRDGYRVIAPDLLGYGGSDLPDGPYSIQRHADVVEGFLDALDLRSVHLVGVSMGGGVAIQVAIDRPENVETLVPIDAYGLGSDLPNGALSYVLARVQVLNKLSVALLRQSRGLTRASLGNIVHGLDSLDPAAVDAAYAELQRPTAGAAFRRFRDAEVSREGYRTTFTDRFDQLAVPTRFLHGAHDDLFPVAWAERAAGRVSDAELRVLDDCAHWLPREDPDAVAQFVRDAVSSD
jgi:pimeloyl-ACP methyl ester carboxylesterase